jgi:hypothetical protein
MADVGCRDIPGRSMGGTESCSETHLPVYEVIGTGIEEGDAKKLAKALKIPVEKVLWRDGMAAFIDPTNYLAVPTVSVADPEIVAALRRGTTNRYPDIPIELKAIDYTALGRLTPLGLEEAFRSTSVALEAAGLTPERATPVVGHTVFKTVSTASQRDVPSSTTTNLDTQVSYRFTLDGVVKVTGFTAAQGDTPARNRRSTRQGRATPLMRPSVSACKPAA